MAGEASEAVVTVPGEAGLERAERATIPPEYKEVLLRSADYRKWLHLKNSFLRRRGALASRPAPAPAQDKFPHFPGAESNSVEEEPPSPRPQREIPAGLVKEEGGTLYRASPRPRPKPRPAPVTVSSLPRPTTPRTTPYVSPLYSAATPQPPLPPGYELIPVSDLTPDHEVMLVSIISDIRA